jgi:hypothetical protein
MTQGGEERYVLAVSCPRGCGEMVEIAAACGDDEPGCECEQLMECSTCGWMRALTCACHSAARHGWEVNDEYDCDEVIPVGRDAVTEYREEQERRK